MAWQFVALVALLVGVANGQYYGFMVDKNGDVLRRAPNWYEVTRWRTGTAMLHTSGQFNMNSGRFTAPASGVYMVSSQINLLKAQTNYFRTIIAVNGQLNVHNSLHAITSNQPYDQFTMNVNGLIYLNEGDYISVYVYSRSDNYYTVDSSSGFSGYYLGTLYSHLGFANDLGRNWNVRRTGWTEIGSWSQYSYSYLFVSGTGFDSARGRFTAPCAGLYYAAANVRLDGANGNYFRLVICISGRCDVNGGMHSIEGYPRSPYYTMNVAGVVYLAAGQYLSVFVYSNNDNNFWVQSESGFSAAYLGPPAAWMPAFLADKNPSQRYAPRNGLAEIQRWRTSRATGLYATSGFNVGNGRFYAPVDGYYFFTAQVRLDAAYASYSSIRLLYNGQNTEANGMQSYRQNSRARKPYLTLKVTGVVKMSRGGYVSIWLYLAPGSNRNAWVQGETGFSGAYMGPNMPHPGVHADGTKDTRVGIPGWREITQWGVGFNGNNGLYSTDAAWNGRRYTANAPGIYYVGANIRLDYATQSPFSRVVIAVNGNYSASNGMRAIESYQKAFTTMSVAGFMRLLSGDTVSVYAYTQDKSFITSTSSGFSVNRMGSEFDRPAFLARLRGNLTAKAGQFQRLVNWTTAGANGLFQSDLNFNPVTGFFTASSTGYYSAAAQVQFDNTQTNAYYRVVIAINNVGDVNNGLHAIRGTTTKISHFTESVAGTVYLTKGQTLSVGVYGNKGTYTIGQESGFSVCRLNDVEYGFQGDLSSTQLFTRTGWSTLTRNWNAPASRGMWIKGFTQRNGVLTVPRDGTGVYIVSAQVRIDQAGGNNFRAQIVINGQNNNNGLLSMQGQPITTYYSMQVVGTAFLRGGSTLSIEIYSSNDNRYTVQTETGFSAVLVSSPPTVKPSLLADVPNTITVRKTGWSEINIYITHSSQWWSWGLHKQGPGTLKAGRYTIPTTGIYWIMGNVRLNGAAGNWMRIAISISGRAPDINGAMHSVTGLPSPTYYTLHVSGAMYLTAKQTVSIMVYSRSDNLYYIDSESTLSIQYLGAYGTIPAFLADLVSNARYTSPGRYYKTGNWRISGSLGLFTSMGGFNKAAGTYTVPVSGIYMVSTNYRLDGADTGYFRVAMAINGAVNLNNGLSTIKSGSLHKRYQTVNIFGAIPLSKGDQLSVVAQSSSDRSWYVQTESGFSAAYIGPMGQVRGVHAVRPFTWSTTRRNTWFELWTWQSQGAPGLFADQYFSTVTGRYTTQASGKYYVAANIRFNQVDARSYIYMKIIINRNVGGRSRVTSLMGDQVQNGQPNTLSASAVLYLPSFTIISLAIYVSNDGFYQIDKESSYTVLYLGTYDHPECLRGGPVIAVNPVNTQALVAGTAVFFCKALSVPGPVYQWRLNGQVIPGQTGPYLTLSPVQNSHAGAYQCRATANGRTVSSTTARLTVYGHDGTVPGFTADVLSNRNYRVAGRWFTVTSYRTSSPGLATLYDSGSFNEGNGKFKAPLAGVYIVAANLRLDQISGGSAKMMISINGGTGTANGLTSVLDSPTTYQTLTVNGAVYLKKDQTIEVKALSQTDNNWNVQEESGFSARYLAPLSAVPGMFWELIRDSPNQGTGWYEVKNWRTLYGQQVGTGFYPQDGRYTVPCDGIYYVAANIRLDGANGRYFRTIVAVNQTLDVSNGLHSIQGSPRGGFYTMNVVGVVYLTKNSNVSVFVYSNSDSSWKVQSDSSFSVAYLSPKNPSIPGMHADLSKDLAIRKTGCVTVTNWRVTSAKGLYQSGGQFNPTTGTFTAGTGGFYHVSALIRLDGAAGWYFRLMILVNGTQTIQNGLHAMRGFPPSSYYTMKVGGVIPLTTGSKVTVVACSQTDNNWRIQHESGFSIHLMERISPGVHAELSGNQRQTKSGWVQVTKWRTNPGKSDGLFQTGAQFNPTTGYYSVATPGIYYVAANVRLDQLNQGNARMIISVNKDRNPNGLHAMETFLPQKNQQFSLRISGFLHLDGGDNVSVWINAATDKSWTIQSESGFSLAYIGAPLSIPAFLADYNRNINYRRTGWFELIGPWRTSGVTSLFNSGGQAFNPKAGRFVAPVTGTYWVIANVRFSGLSKGQLMVAIGVNSQYSTTKHIFATRGVPSNANAFSLSASGALQLQRDDYVSVWVGSVGETTWSVASQTSFSAALLGTFLLPGFNFMGPSLSRARSGWIRQTQWDNSVSYGLFNTFGSAPRNGLFRAPQSGWYIVAANSHITSGTGFMRCLIGIDLSLTPNNGLHSAQGNPPGDISPTVAGVVRLRANQTLSVHFYSQSSTKYNYSTQGFSVAAIAPPNPTPSLHAFRWGYNVAKAGWLTISGFGTINQYAWEYDTVTNLFTSGNSFVSPADGVYWVTGLVELVNAASGFFRLVASVNGQYSLNGGLHAVTGTPSIGTYSMTVSGALFLKAQDKVQLTVYSNTDASYRVNRAHFTIQFVEYGSASVGFNVDLVRDVTVRRTGWYFVPTWQNRTQVANGLYINDTGLNTGTGKYTAPYTGIYLVAAQLRLDLADQGYFRVKLALNGSTSTEIGMSAVKTGATHKLYHTLSLAGALYLTAGSTLQPAGYSSADKNWRFQHETGFSAVYLAPYGQVPAVHAKLANTLTFARAGTYAIGKWSTNNGQAPFMSNKLFSESNGIYTAIYTGNYYVAAMIRINNVQSGNIAVQTRINGRTPPPLHGFEGMPTANTKTLSYNTITVSGMVRLNRFDKLRVYVWIQSGKNWAIDAESSLSIVFMGGSEPTRCPLTGVSILQHPVGGIAPVKGTYNFSCEAVASGDITYSWYFKNKVIPGATNSFYNITSVSLANKGYYRCVAQSGNDKASSWNVFLNVYNPFPVCKPQIIRTKVFENVGVNTKIFQAYAIAQTPDFKPQPVYYKIIAGNDNSFNISRTNGGVFRAKRNIDRERKAFYNLTVQAQNQKCTKCTTNCYALVTVLDRCDNPPIFKPSSRYRVNLTENAHVGTPVVTLSTTDKDVGINARVAYNITGGNRFNFFKLNGPQIVVAKSPDRDILKYWKGVVSIWVRAYNPGTTCPSRTARIDITIMDLNDNAPIFRSKSYTFNVSEAAKLNTRLGVVRADDADTANTPNSTITYSISRGNVPVMFKIDPKWGGFRLANTLDYEKIRQYTVTVRGRDGGNPYLQAEVQVTVNVENADEHCPLFTLPNYNTRLQENMPAGQSVVTVLATDKDKDTFTYSVSNPLFSVNASGFIATTGPLDREKSDPYTFTVMATVVPEVNQTVTCATGTATVTVDVLDVNDNTPKYTTGTYSFTINENLPIGGVVGTVTANDPDEDQNGAVTYSILTTQSKFYIQPSTGIIDLVASLDYETQNSYTFVIQAADGGTPSLSGTATVQVTVQNANRYSPQFSQLAYSVSLAENATIGTSVGMVSATDKDPGTGLVYSIIHGGDGKFVINNSTGVISVAKTLDYEQQQGFELVVLCSDGFPQPLTNVTFVYMNLVDINDNAPTFTPRTDTVFVSSLAPAGTIVYVPVATDADSGSNAALTYSVVGAQASLFNFSTANGTMVLAQDASTIKTAIVQVSLFAKDGGNPSMQNSTVLTLNIKAADGRTPNFAVNPFRALVAENVALLTPITRVQAFMTEQSQSGNIRYQLSGSSMFSINSETGVVMATQSLDREAADSVSLTVAASLTSSAGSQTSQLITTNSQLIILLQDFNDNAPTFGATMYAGNVSKAEPAGTPVVTVAATDSDIGSNAVVRYSIMSGSEGVFRIDPYLGTIYTTQQLNPALQSMYSLTVGATNPVLYPLTSTAVVNITVLDINDQAPAFIHPVYYFSVPETTLLNSRVGQVSAIDHDTGSFGQLRYRLVPTTKWSQNFTIDPVTGVITANNQLDREKKLRYWFQAQVIDGGNLRDTAGVWVFLNDVNDNPPVFNPSVYTIAVSMGILPKTGVAALRCKDKDFGVNGTIGLSYKIISGDPHQRFQVDSTGVISTRQILTGTGDTNYLMTVQAQDGGPVPKTATATVNITVIPQSSVAPKFEHGSYSVYLNEPVPANTLILTVSATGNGTVTYSKRSVNVPFKVNRKNGTITTNRLLNAEELSDWVFSVAARDRYGRFGYAIVHVKVIHVNEFPPVFTQKVYNTAVNESTPVGTAFGFRVVATDRDGGADGTITYGISQQNTFGINSATGAISVIGTLDREQREFYTMIVTATDGGTVTRFTAMATLKIQILDANDNIPVFTKTTFNGSVIEHMPVGTYVATVSATDADTPVNANITYAIAHGSQYFTINQYTGVISSTFKFDREVRSFYTFTVTATDGYPKHNAIAQVNVYVIDANDHPPVFQAQTYPATVNVTAIRGTPIVKVLAVDPDIGNNSRVGYRLLLPQDLLTYINITSSGQIELIKGNIKSTKDYYEIPIIAYDMANVSMTARATLELTIALRPTVAPPAAQGQDSSGVSAGATAGIALASVSITILVIIIIVIVYRRQQPKHEPFDGDTVKYDADSGHLAGVGISNPMYAAGGEVVDPGTYENEAASAAKYGL